MNRLFISLFAVSLVGSSAFASGFRCEGEGFTVRMNNETYIKHSQLLAVLVISHEDASPRTVLVAEGEEIRKANQKNTVRYTVDAEQMGLDKAILQIAFKEGKETLEKGEIVTGQLVGR